MSRGGQPEGFLSIIPQLLSGVCGLKLSDGIRDGGTFWGLQLYYASCHISIKIAPLSRPHAGLATVTYIVQAANFWCATIGK